MVRILLWLKSNVTFLFLGLTILSTTNAASYLKGRADGYERHQLVAQADKSKALADVVSRLDVLQGVQSDHYLNLMRTNQNLSIKLDAKNENITQTIREKVIEKPVYVTADCRVDYNIVELLNEAATNPDNN